MRPEIFLSLGLLFLAHAVPSKAESVGAASGAGEKTVSVRVGAPLTVECSVRVEQRVEWRLDGGGVPADLAGAGEAPAPGGRLAARLHAAAARPHHAGLYTCERDPSPAAHRVRVFVTALPAPAPADEVEATTVAAPMAAAVEAVAGAGAGDDDHVVYYDVGRMFSLNCTPTGLADNTKLSYVWKKNGTAVESVWDLAGRYTLEEPAVFRMNTKRTTEEDFGNYTCEPAGGPTLTFQVRGRPYAKLPPNTNVVEDTKLKIVCKVLGKPYPRVVWTFSNDSDVGAGNGTPVHEALGERVKLSPNDQGVEDGQLEVEAAARTDAGVYTCAPDAAGADATLASTTLRVKDKYAALWPFLGICAEVFVLCAIILVYEKRRTKPELDDSDTDNHDQKKS